MWRPGLSWRKWRLGRRIRGRRLQWPWVVWRFLESPWSWDFEADQYREKMGKQKTWQYNYGCQREKGLISFKIHRATLDFILRNNLVPMELTRPTGQSPKWIKLRWNIKFHAAHITNFFVMLELLKKWPLKYRMLRWKRPEHKDIPTEKKDHRPNCRDIRSQFHRWQWPKRWMSDEVQNSQTSFDHLDTVYSVISVYSLAS